MRRNSMKRMMHLLVALTGVIVILGIGGTSLVGTLPGAHAAAKTIPSWPGSSAQYVGRYRLTASSDPTIATRGELTVFLRIIPRVPKPALGGILSLATGKQSNVLYLTMFKHSGTQLWTSVNIGLFAGPVIGTFNVVSLKGTHLKAQIVQTGKTPIALTFVYFSKNPHP